ncbi:MAG: flagellar assembly factor fliW [Candidatus Midichloriaceae bacterium]|jgi:flagellar assembly factor FliW|nr:flagellar assembly factor fliW [Candidatus Midichloriaceae bacterium]
MHNLKEKQIESTIRIIQNHFGEFKIDISKEVTFPNGLIGMNPATKFVIAPCPIEKFKDFMVLQSLQNDDLALMVQPINDINSSDYHEGTELTDSAKAIGIDPSSTAVVLVASLKEEEGLKRLVVNARAPIFIDATNMTAFQYVLTNPNYKIQENVILCQIS